MMMMTGLAFYAKINALVFNAQPYAMSYNCCTLSLLHCGMQVQTLTDVNQRLQASLADATKAHQAERLKRDNLHKQVSSLWGRLSSC